MKSKIDKDILNKDIENSNVDSDVKGIEILNRHKIKSEEERQKRIGKTLNEVMGEYEEKKNKESKIKVKIRTLVFSIISLLVMLVIYFLFYYAPILGIGFNIEQELDTSQKIDIVSSEQDIYMEYGSELLIYSNGVVSTYNSNAKKTWEYKIVDNFIPNIYVQGNYMLITDNSNGTIYLFQNKQEILNKKLDGTINNAFLDDNGNMAIEYSTSGYKKVIGVYSKKGKNLYNSHLNSGEIIDLKLLNNAQKLLVFQTNSKSFKIGVTVGIIDSKDQEANVSQIAKIDNNYLYDLTIKGQNIIMLLDDKIIKLNIVTNQVTELRNFMSSQLMFIAINDNYYTTIEKALNLDEDKYSFNTLRYDNSNISTMELENSPKVMKSGNLLNYFVYQDSLKGINKWGVTVKNVKIDFPPKDVVIFGNEKSVALIYTNKVYVLSL